METIIEIMFGWPAVILALLVSFVGMFKRSCQFLIAASLLSLPFSLYITGGADTIWKAFLFIPISFLLACYLNKKDKHYISWLLILIDVVMLIYAGVSVITQSRV